MPMLRWATREGDGAKIIFELFLKGIDNVDIYSYILYIETAVQKSEKRRTQWQKD